MSSCNDDNMMIIDESTTYRMIFDGNSWVSGTGSTGGKNYPKQLSDLLNSDGKTTSRINYGVYGQTIYRMESDASTQIDPNVSTANILIGLEIVNTWGFNENETKEHIYDLYKQYFLNRKEAGFEYIIALTPISQTFYDRPDWEVAKLYFRTQMLAEFPDLGIHVADVGADARLSDSKDLTYYKADGIHLNNAGYGVMAEIVYNTVISLEIK